VTYTHSSGVARNIDWKFEFTYASGEGAARFIFLPSPIASPVGDISGLYSVHAEADFAIPSTLSVALAETETSKFRVCFHVDGRAQLPCSFVSLPDLFSKDFHSLLLPYSSKFRNSSVDAVVTGYVLSPCTCPLIITFGTSNLIAIHWDSVTKIKIGRDNFQNSIRSVQVDAKLGFSHFLRAVFTQAMHSNFGSIQLDVAVDPLFLVSFTPGFKFIPKFYVMTPNPTVLMVAPGDLCSTKSMFWGSGLSFAFPNGVSNPFFIQCRDHWGNNRTIVNPTIFFMLKLHLITPLATLAPLRYTSFSDSGFGVISSPYTHDYTSHSHIFSLHVFLSQSLRRGLFATYFSDNQLQAPFKVVPDYDLNEAVTRAFPLTGGDPSNLFSLRWTGLIRPSVSTNQLTFALSVGANAFVSLWIDGVLLISLHNYATVSTSMTATVKSTGIASSYYEINLEYKHFNKLSSFWTVNLAINSVLISKEHFVAVEKLIASKFVSQIWPTHPTETTKSSIAGIGISIMTAGMLSILTVVVKDTSGAPYPLSFWDSRVLVARLVPADDSIAPWPREGDLGWATFPTTSASFKTGSVCFNCPSQVVGSVASNGSPSGFIVSFFPTISGSYYMSLSIAILGSLHSTFYGAASSEVITSITSMTASLSSNGVFPTSSRVYNMNSLRLHAKQYFGHYIGTTDSSVANKFAFGIGLTSGQAGLSDVSSGTYRSLHRISPQVSFSSGRSLDFSRASVPPITGIASVAFTSVCLHLIINTVFV
jgi:hypothetical protein